MKIGWKAVLLWLGRQIAQAAIEEAANRVSKKKLAASSAREEALRLAQASIALEDEAKQLEAINPVELLGKVRDV